MSKVVSLQPPTFVSGAKVNINFPECEHLIKMMDGLSSANNALPPTVARFVAKNKKRLRAAYLKVTNAQEALILEYAEKDEKGRALWWDKQDKRTNEAGEEVPENEQAIHGIKAIKNDKGQLADTWTKQLVLANKIGQMDLYIIGDEKQKEFEEKYNSLSNDKNEVHVLKIENEYLSESNVGIPTKIQYPGQQYPERLNLEAFYEYLVNDDENNELNGTGTEN